MPSTRTIVVAALLCLPAGAAAQRADSAAFIIRLGHDTTAIERYVRTPDRLVAEAVQRSPSTTVHRLEVDLGPGGAARRSVYTVTSAGGAPLLTRTVGYDGDSATVEQRQGATTRTARVAVSHPVPFSGPMYSPYETALMRATAGRATSTTVQLHQGFATVDIPIERLGRDSVSLTNQFGEPMRAHVDASGRLLHLNTPAFTTVERTGWVDMDAWVLEFAERDRTGRGMGPLSPRHTYRTRIGEATLWVDYGRPGMRGRPVWGGLVPHGQVWRMGANDAAHLATDRPLDLGGLELEPGTYTLFLLPAADGWTLIVNRKTGGSGLEYDEGQDVGRVPLTVEAVEAPAEQFTIEVRGGSSPALVVAWDRMRGSTPIRVR
jgi:hypothetical protein